MWLYVLGHKLQLSLIVQSELTLRDFGAFTTAPTSAQTIDIETPQLVTASPSVNQEEGSPGSPEYIPLTETQKEASNTHPERAEA